MKHIYATQLRHLLASLLILGLPAAVQADDKLGMIVFAGYSVGGDTLVKTTDGREMTAGSGFNFGLGFDLPITETGDIGVRMNIGMKVDAISYSGGTASFTRIPLELLLTVLDDETIMGLGVAIHGDPTIEVTLNNVTASQTLDTAAGLTLIMAWAPSDTPVEVGFQATMIDYTVPGGGTINGNSIGLYAGYKF